MQLILTCEHASNKIPEAYINYFEGAHTLLNTHQGWDIGAAQVFNIMENEFDCFSIKGEYSRLLIELNRNLAAKDLFSKYIKEASETEKQQIIKSYYQPYMNMVELQIEKALSQQKDVLHLSIHSFTSVMKGVERNCDIGLLYDSQREREQNFCKSLQQIISQQSLDYIVRRNYPYRGSANGLTTICRKKFGQRYMGIEIELNQKLLLDLPSCQKMGLFLTRCLTEALGSMPA